MGSVFNQKIIDKLFEVSKELGYVELTAAVSVNGQREYRMWNGEGEQPFFEYNYEIGSITKTFTGLLVAKAIGLGKAGFNDSLSLWFPEIEKNVALPSIKQLVTHSAGYASYFPAIEDDNSETLETPKNPLENLKREDLIASLQKVKNYETSYPHAYSNFGAALAGLLVERIFKKSYKELMEELFFELGMKKTIMYPTGEIGLHGYDKNGKCCESWCWPETCGFAPAGSLVSTAHDMINYCEAILKKDKPYIPISVDPLALYINDGTKIEIGCFWFLLSDYSILYFFGETFSFNAAIAIDIKEKNSLVLLSNRHMPGSGDFIISLLLSLRNG